MASNNTKKQVHVSPGIYFSESELSVAAKSLGIWVKGKSYSSTKKTTLFSPNFLIKSSKSLVGVILFEDSSTPNLKAISLMKLQKFWHSNG